MLKFLLFLSKVSLTHPKRTLGILFLLVLASGLLIPHIPLSTSNLDLINPEAPEVQQFMEFGQKFGSPNSIFLGIKGGTENELKKAADQLIPRLKALPGIKDVLGKLPLSEKTAEELGLETYIFSHDRSMILILIQPVDLKTEVSQAKVLIEDIHKTVILPTPMTWRLTGIPVYALSDQQIIKQDIQWLSFLALAGIALVFFLGFRSFFSPLIAVISLMTAIAITMGFIFFLPGRLTILSASFASLIIGLGIDFAIHIIHRFEYLFQQGRKKQDAIMQALLDSAPGMVTGALTTCLVFISLMFTGFLGFQELGLIGAMGLLLSLTVMMTGFPAALSILPLKVFKPSLPVTQKCHLRLSIFGTVLACTLALSLFFGLAQGFPRFDSNYLNLQPRNSEAVALEKDIFAKFDLSTQFAAFTAHDAAQAENLIQKLQILPEVKQVASYCDYELLQADGYELNLTPEFKAGFVSKQGEYAVFAYPSGNIWDMKTQEVFYSKMQSLQEDVTGMPILGHFMLQKTRSALMISGCLSVFFIFLVVVLDFRSVKWTLLALLPVAATACVLPGLMSLFRLDFNPINIMAVPLILGISVDDGVHFVHRFRMCGHSIIQTMQQTGKSVLITSLTNLIAFGTLLLTSHRGMQSFALLLCLGITYALLVSLTVLPFLLSRFNTTSWERVPRGNTFKLPG